MLYYSGDNTWFGLIMVGHWDRHKVDENGGTGSEYLPWLPISTATAMSISRPPERPVFIFLKTVAQAVMIA
jgi:hypothetical protein